MLHPLKKKLFCVAQWWIGGSIHYALGNNCSNHFVLRQKKVRIDSQYNLDMIQMSVVYKISAIWMTFQWTFIYQYRGFIASICHSIISFLK